MTRRLFKTLMNVICLASISLFVAICVLWVRSYSFGDDLSWGSQRDATRELAQFEAAISPHGVLAIRYEYWHLKSEELYDKFRAAVTVQDISRRWLWPAALPKGDPAQGWFEYARLVPADDIVHELPDQFHAVGVRFGRVDQPRKASRWFVSIPLWLLAEIAVLPTVIWLLRWWVPPAEFAARACRRRPAQNRIIIARWQNLRASGITCLSGRIGVSAVMTGYGNGRLPMSEVSLSTGTRKQKLLFKCITHDKIPVVVCGNVAELGEWDLDAGLQMYANVCFKAALNGPPRPNCRRGRRLNISLSRNRNREQAGNLATTAASLLFPSCPRWTATSGSNRQGWFFFLSVPGNFAEESRFAGFVGIFLGPGR